MSKWEKVKLGDTATYVNGCAFKPDDWENKGLPIIRIQNLTGSSSEINYFNKSYNSKYEINDGDVLISWSASLGVYKWNKGKAILNQHIFKVVFDKTDIDKDYFVYAVRQLLNDMEKETHGSTMKHITKSRFDNMTISLPPIKTQRQIAQTLDTAAELLTLRKQQLAELDNLIKSTFYDMFGDPVTNEKGWQLKKLPQLIANTKNALKRGPFGGALKKEIFVDEGYLVYEQNHALNNDYSFKRYFIDQRTYNELKDFEVKPGDILISCSGVYLGKLSIVPKYALPGIINQALLKVTLNNEEMNQTFFVYVFSNSNFKNKYITSDRGSGIPNLPPMPVIKKIDFITPPLSLQNKFAYIVNRIEEQKALVQKAIDETQLLFDSLMSEYFD